MAYLVSGTVTGYDGLRLPEGSVLRFIPSGAGRGAGLVAQRPVEAAVAGLRFTVWLEATDELTPVRHYTVVAEWPDGAGGFTQISIWDRFYVPTGGGEISTFLDQPTRGDQVRVTLDPGPEYRGLWLDCDPDAYPEDTTDTGSGILYRRVTSVSGFIDVPLASLRGKDGADGIDAPGAVPSDTSVASFFASPSSLTFLEASKHFAIMGPEPSGGDDTAALQAALLEAQATGGILRLHPGHYHHTGLATAQDFQQPLVFGAGAMLTILEDVSGGGTGIKFVGGAAGFSGGGLNDMTVMGVGTIGVEMEGACGMRHRRIRFKDLAVGGLFHNAKSGDFSEQDVFEDCTFEASCDLWLEYRTTGGNVSFHGSGFQDCMFNAGATDTSPKIRIGSNVLIYNAPWDGWFWTHGGISLVDVSALNKRLFTYGTIRVESFGGETYWSTAIPSGFTWSHAGETMVLGETVRFNRRNTSSPFALVDRVLSRTDSSVSRSRKPTLTQWDLGTGSTDTFDFDNGESCLVNVQISASNYLYEYMLAVHRNPENDNGTVTILANGRNFNSAMYGAPAFSIVGRRLRITNASYPSSGVTAQVNLMQITPRSGLS